MTEKTTSSSSNAQPAAERRIEEQLEEIREQLKEETDQIQSSGRWLPVMLFFATFLGTLLGLAADVADASGLVVPVVEFFNPAPELHIVGSNTILGEGIEMADEWAAAFQRQKVEEINVPLAGSLPQTVKVTIEGIGTVKGIEEAIAQATTGDQVDIHILAASEPMSAGQEEQLATAGVDIVCAAEIGYDVIAFVTDRNNETPAINTRDVSDILVGNITNWSAVGGSAQPIRIFARPGSGTTEIVLLAFTGSPDIPDNYIRCDSNSDCLDRTLGTPGALYWVSTAWMRTQPTQYLAVVQTRRDLNLPPEDPLSEDFNIDRYTRELIRPLYMYVLGGDKINSESLELAQEFLRYVRGVQGQEVLEKHHFYTFFDPPADVAVELPAEFAVQGDELRPVCR